MNHGNLQLSFFKEFFMKFCRSFVPLLLAVTLLHAQDDKSPKRKGPRADEIPTSSLISQPGPSFQVPETEIGDHAKLIVYGDQRFTDPANTKVTNPKVRRL